MENKTIVIIDDEQELLDGLKSMINSELPELKVWVSTDPFFAIETVQNQQTTLVITDIRMPQLDGFELLQKLKDIDPAVTVVMMTAFGRIEDAVEAVKRGAFDYISKPFDYAYLFKVITMAVQRNEIIRENISLKRRFSDRVNFANFVGQSRRMQQFYDNIQAVSRTDYTVLVRGESGTGKELTAKAIHSLSERKDGPIVMINCPAIPEHLLESELFGHTKGAFTGADFERNGLLVESDGGTICLDEIGDIPTSVQTKLLRFLQEGEVRPLGSAKTVKVDVRVIAMTNQDLEQKIAEGLFRSDLFYRLNVVTVNTPCLNDIEEDIPLLVNHFVQLACTEQGVSQKKAGSDVVKALTLRKWPGNVRELQNLIRRAVMYSKNDEIQIDDIIEIGDSSGEQVQKTTFHDGNSHNLNYKDAKENVMRAFSRDYFSKLLLKTDGNVSKAAKISCLSRAAFQKIMRRYQISASEYRTT